LAGGEYSGLAVEEECWIGGSSSVERRWSPSLVMSRFSFALVASSILLVNGASSSHPEQGRYKIGGVFSEVIFIAFSRCL